MSKIRRKIGNEERLVVGGVVIIDDDPEVRNAVADRVRLSLGEGTAVFAPEDSDDAVALLTSLREDPETEVLVILVNLSSGGKASVPALQGLIRRMRGVAPEAPAIAYVDRPVAEVQKLAARAGASTCVALKDLEAAVYGVFLEDEFRGLCDSSPAVAGVVDTIDLGINILSPQMNVLWANERLSPLVSEADRTRQPCWSRFHKFHHRQWACTSCTAAGTLREALAKVEAGVAVDNGRAIGSHLLPLWGRVARVDVSTAPLLSPDKCRVLAVIEASRVVTEAWEKNTEAHHRIHEVIEAVRMMGQEREDSPPLAAVAVYYRLDGGDDLHLFDTAVQKDFRVPSVVRSGKSSIVYFEALKDGRPRFFDDAVDDLTHRHFVLGARTKMGRDVAIDVVYSDEKPRGLFTEDLRPYWQYVVDTLDEAYDTREKAFERSANSFLESFLAQTANGIRDDAGLEEVLQAAVDCVNSALHPFSMYIRTLDRRTSTLVKRKGLGPYYKISPEARPLQHNGIASGKAAARREVVWSEHGDVEYVRRCVGRTLTPAEDLDLQRIVGHGTLSLVCADRVLGALCIQFDDDSALSPAKRSFVEAMAIALGNALGSLEWAQQRRTIGKYSEDLDRLMFLRSEHPEEEESELLAQVTCKVFDLTAAEMVAYYRCDAQSRTLTLVPSATQGTVPAGMALPQVIPPEVGVVSLAVSSREGHRVWDYRTPDWQATRERLLACLERAPENEFCRWVCSEIAEPVVGRQRAVEGVLVAFSSIPGWLSVGDQEVVREFAFKTGLCLEAKELMRKLNWHTRTRISLNDVTAAMARTSDVGTLYRLLLLAVTADECLGFSRAMVLLRERGSHRFAAAEAVGAQSRPLAEEQWEEATTLPLGHKIAACAQNPARRPGDLGELIGQLTMDLEQNPDVLRTFEDGKMVVHRHNQPHVLREPQLLAALHPQTGEEGEYVLAPLILDGAVVGAVLADRAFLPDRRIGKECLDLMLVLTHDFALMLEAIRLRHEEAAATIAKELARGVSYSLRTRAAALKGRIANFAHALGGAHQADIDSLKRAVQFFWRTGTLASKLPMLDEIAVGRGELLDVNALLAEMVDALADERIVFKCAENGVLVRAERHYIEDIFLEVVWNACEFADPEKGRIRIEISEEPAMVQVHVVDNGPGIPPHFRPRLFKPFSCHPASRKGLGLGLSYVARLVVAYGGTLDEIGVWRQGAHFVVRLPPARREQNG